MKYLKYFENNKPIINNNWMFKIKIKDLLSDESLVFPTDEAKAEVIKISNRLIQELSKLERKTIGSNLKEDEKEVCLEELEEIKSNIEFLKQLADGSIPEKDWHDFSFHGNFEELINEYLSVIYDLGDKRVINKRNELIKYFWVY